MRLCFVPCSHFWSSYSYTRCKHCTIDLCNACTISTVMHLQHPKLLPYLEGMLWPWLLIFNFSLFQCGRQKHMLNSVTEIKGTILTIWSHQCSTGTTSQFKHYSRGTQLKQNWEPFFLTQESHARAACLPMNGAHGKMASRLLQFAFQVFFIQINWLHYNN